MTTRQPIGSGVHFKVPFLENVDYPQTSQSTYQLPEQSVYTNHEGSRTLTPPPASESHRSVVRPANPAMPRSEEDVRRLLACRLTPCDRKVL